jgi:glycosyltransferase involved in cell wall biosynthesis
MNILIIAQYFTPDWSGSSTRAYNCARALVLEGCNVTVITAFPHYPNGYPSNSYRNKVLSFEEIDGIRVIRTWVPNISHSTNARRITIHLSFILSSLLAIFYIRKFDIIIAMNPNLFAFFPALIYKILYRKNIIRNIDDLWPEVFYDLGIVRSRLFKIILDFIANITYRIPKMIVPLSHGYVKTLTDKYHVPLEKIVVIEHGVDTAKFSSIRGLQDVSTKGAKKIIVYSGILTNAYDFETILEAAKILDSEPVHFIIRGTGDYANKLQTMIERYNLFNSEIRTNTLSRDDLISFLNTADIFLLPMNSFNIVDQGLPTKTLEYQAMGKPIICISNGEAGRYINETQSGLVTRDRDPNKVADLIMNLVNDEDLARTLGSNGCNYIKNNLTLEMIGKRFMKVITESIN